MFDDPPEEVLFREIVDAIEDYAVVVLDPAGHIRTWNRGAERIEGCTADEVLGRHFSMFYPPRTSTGATPRGRSTSRPRRGGT